MKPINTADIDTHHKIKFLLMSFLKLTKYQLFLITNFYSRAILSSLHQSRIDCLDSVFYEWSENKEHLEKKRKNNKTIIKLDEIELSINSHKFFNTQFYYDVNSNSLFFHFSDNKLVHWLFPSEFVIEFLSSFEPYEVTWALFIFRRL